jgi:hypothetical protein
LRIPDFESGASTSSTTPARFNEQKSKAAAVNEGGIVLKTIPEGNP